MGKDLISEVTCSEPYEWKDPTGEEWEFNAKAMERAGKQPFHVSAAAAACEEHAVCGGGSNWGRAHRQQGAAKMHRSLRSLSASRHILALARLQRRCLIVCATVQVVAYDFGIKHNILRRLAAQGCKLTVVPADYPPEKVLAMNPDGIFLSNGPVRSSAQYALRQPHLLRGGILVLTSFACMTSSMVRLDAHALCVPADAGIYC